MFRKIIISILFISMFLLSSITYANNNKLTIESYKIYLKENNLKSFEEKFDKLTEKEKEIFINDINNGNFIIEKKVVSKNDMSFRIPYEEESGRYKEEINWIFRNTLGIPISNIKIFYDFNYIGNKITKINPATRMEFDYNFNPILDINVNSFSEIEKTNPYPYIYNYSGDWLKLTGIIKYSVGIQNLGGITFKTERPEFWISANRKHSFNI